MTDTAPKLREVLDKYASPKPGIVLKIPGRGFQPEYVGHADATRTLIEIDPEWSWEPQAWNAEGGPVVVERNGQLVMWGFLTLLGKRMPCVGTCPSDKKEADKELIGDLIRNGAMRFGIFINLWSKADHDEATQPAASAPAEPEPIEFVWDQERWQMLKERLRTLPEVGREAVITELENEGLFVARTAQVPFTFAQLDRIESLIANDGVHDYDTETAGPSPAALLIVTEATGFDDPTERAEVEPWMWELAEVADLDAHDWKVTAKAASMRQRDILDMAQGVVDGMNEGVPEEEQTPAPVRLDEIHGDVATELRLKLISSSAPF